MRILFGDYLLEQLALHFQATQTLLQALTEFLQTRKSVVGGELSAIQNFGLIAPHQDVEVCRRGFRSWRARLIEEGPLFLAPSRYLPVLNELGVYSLSVK